MKLLAVADGQLGVSRGVKNMLAPFINDRQVQGTRLQGSVPLQPFAHRAIYLDVSLPSHENRRSQEEFGLGRDVFSR
jgi:hypothetical protein